jgi:hypothetical protein
MDKGDSFSFAFSFSSLTKILCYQPKRRWASTARPAPTLLKKSPSMRRALGSRVAMHSRRMGTPLTPLVKNTVSTASLRTPAFASKVLRVLPICSTNSSDACSNSMRTACGAGSAPGDPDAGLRYRRRTGQSWLSPPARPAKGRRGRGSA